MNGQLNATFPELHTAGCIQAERATRDGMMLFFGLMQQTNNNPCNGCPAFDEGRCKAYKQYHTLPNSVKVATANRIKHATKPSGTDKYPDMSVKQIAATLGISKNEVRRRKQAGTL